MEFPIAPAATVEIPLERILVRLRRHDLVRGILLVGSTGTGEVTPSSDYDVVLVLAELPAPATIIATWIGGHYAEVICTTTAAVERVIADPNGWPANVSQEETLLRWLRNGRIAHDPTGLLARASAIARSTQPAVPHESAVYTAWWRINYNVAHMRRYVASDDPLSATAARMRFLYSLMELVSHYFTIRRLPWEGEKAAVRHFMEHDPRFLEILNRAMAANDLRYKGRLYEQLAALTLEPVGGLLNAASTAVSLGGGWGTGQEPVDGPVRAQAIAALDLWHRVAGVE